MPASHRNGDRRACGAVTIAVGQNFVLINGQPWAVVGDPESHGGGNFFENGSHVKINGKSVICVGDLAAGDAYPPYGHPTGATTAATGDSTVTVG